MKTFKQFLNKRVLSVSALAKKHDVDKEYIEKQLKKGIKVEHEHTTKLKVARQIALAHIGEDPDYYKKLKKIENIKEMKKPKWEVPVEPGTTPILPGNVRLYHQTSRPAISSIRRKGIETNQPTEGPRGIYASKPDSEGKGFYGHPDHKSTIEFSVPETDYKYPPFVNQNKVHPDSIIAGHKPWHSKVRYIDDDPKLRADVEEGKFDHLLNTKDDYSKAIRFVKKRAKSKENREK
jgi:hypothetical protein